VGKQISNRNIVLRCATEKDLVVHSMWLFSNKVSVKVKRLNHFKCTDKQHKKTIKW